ncbi:MAG: outer membrane beta-barrel domain-containing protein [Deltaproteobacteria bacterium]|nr:outer membrane beta-barrel domain-containing protein [Deltaproteobacteria bacterium]
MGKLKTIVLSSVMLLVLAVPTATWAQGADGKAEADVPEPPPEAPPPTPDDTPEPPPATPDEDGGPPTLTGTTPEEKLSPEKRWEAAEKTWKDIVVLPRKSFLKRSRLELLPFIGTTINDQLIQHTALGLELNFFLSDIFAIGARGIYFLDNVTNDEFWVRYHLSRVPTLNRYRFAFSGDFSYTPIYGKLTVFNQQIFQYEIFLSGGAGVTNTEVIPRDFQNEPFTNWSLTFPVGGGARFFFTKWLAAQVSLRDYLMIDRFEKPGRTLTNGDDAKENESEAVFVHNILFTVGVSIFFPLDFKYTTFR